MKKIAVVGLGIIGGSIAGALTNAGYEVHGFDKNGASVEYALQAGYIRAEGQNISDFNVVFLCLPPQATLDYLRNGAFEKGALVTDICGVKVQPEKAVLERERGYRYVGIHPMAGKETSGIQSASPTLFKRANLIITRHLKTSQSDVDEIKEYARAMGFGEIVECTAEEHDKKIALTSQLAHVVSNAYVKSEQVVGCEGFTGGSFQDMTRIAGVDETVWTPLYAHNRENIIRELEGFIEHLSEYLVALKNGDDKALSTALQEGRIIRESIKRNQE